ncbi:methyltransferase domain-containing protein [Prosthecobacter sp.]|uniref:methyltransferase domain-containing protein n=1 Tax=Prosthecobacter sp. TaxID=1965333 RepID=UPI0024892E66|nr:methyltransferase domain-containing protein [Prosthecobacter sp.]MDI1314934.1 methyltransferase domain-containing protein [Prosthecobacter sp.]
MKEQHNLEIHRNREAWQRKPLLQQVYAGFHRLIASHLIREVKGLTVELGSGIGSIKQTVPECITSDLFPNPWLDRQENAYRLSFADDAVGNLILFDVWHHLEFPGTALEEFRRVLCPSGRLIVFEPAMGLLGRLVYSLGHHEPVAFQQPVEWFAPADFPAADPPYFAAQSRAHRVFVQGEQREQLKGWRVLKVVRLASLAYLSSGGFSKPQLCPTALHPCLRLLDSLLSRVPSLFAVRLLVVLEKESD